MSRVIMRLVIFIHCLRRLVLAAYSGVVILEFLVVSMLVQLRDWSYINFWYRQQGLNLGEDKRICCQLENVLQLLEELGVLGNADLWCSYVLLKLHHILELVNRFFVAYSKFLPVFINFQQGQFESFKLNLTFATAQLFSILRIFIPPGLVISIFRERCFCTVFNLTFLSYY